MKTLKTLLLLTLMLASICAFAQEDSLSSQPDTLSAPAYPDTVHVALTAKQHAFVIAYMPDKGEVSRLKYINQVAQQIAVPVDSAQVISVAVPVGLVKAMFLTIGSQQERLVASYNREIQASLVKQLYARRPDVLAAIQELVQRNIEDGEALIRYGFEYILKIKE